MNGVAWMRKYGGKRLEELYIPCSHNSTTYTHKLLQQSALEQLILPFAGPWDSCQQLTLKDQLLAGARVIDLRLTSRPNGEVYTVHGLLCMPMAKALAEIKGFLDDSKFKDSECVVLRLNEGYKSVGRTEWSADWDKVAETLERSELRVAQTNTGGTLNQMGGMVVLDIPEQFASSFSKEIYRVCTLKSWHDKELSTNVNAPREMPAKLETWIDARSQAIVAAGEKSKPGHSNLFFLSTPCTPLPEDIAKSYNPLTRFRLEFTSLYMYQDVAWPLIADMLSRKKSDKSLVPMVIELDYISEENCAFVIKLNETMG